MAPLASVTVAPRSHVSIPRLLLTAIVLSAGVTASQPARPEAPSHCATSLSPAAVLQRLNATRTGGAVCHRPGTPTRAAPLAWNPRLAAVAAAQAQDMARVEQMSHRDSRNRDLGERLDAMGYRFSAAAENVAVGYASFDAVVDAWLDSEAHCANLMSAKVAELGLACSDGHADDSGTGRYWTLVLGAPSRRR